MESVDRCRASIGVPSGISIAAVTTSVLVGPALAFARDVIQLLASQAAANASSSESMIRKGPLLLAINLYLVVRWRCRVERSGRFFQKICAPRPVESRLVNNGVTARIGKIVHHHA